MRKISEGAAPRRRPFAPKNYGTSGILRTIGPTQPGVPLPARLDSALPPPARITPRRTRTFNRLMKRPGTPAILAALVLLAAPEIRAQEFSGLAGALVAPESSESTYSW